MYSFIRKILFLLDAEKAHNIGLFGLNILYQCLPEKLFRWIFSIPNYPQQQINSNNLFINLKVGLAAGLDKNAKYYKALASLGFQFIEIGTVTPRPQEGNPKPRLFRLVKDEALINRMGFNNDGVEKIKKRLENKPKEIIIGANIGKNKNTPNENAVHDYLICYTELYNLVDYFVINVSSPNTPDLRALQEKESLIKIISAILNEEKKLKKNNFSKPLFVKIAPDLTDEQLHHIAEVIIQTNITGVICTNTTITRKNLIYEKDVEKYGSGGLSGKPLFEKSIYIIKKMRELLPPDKIIIGVGGIDSGEKAQQMIEAGANAIQVYTAFIYKGPQLITEIRQKLKI